MDPDSLLDLKHQILRMTCNLRKKLDLIRRENLRTFYKANERSKFCKNLSKRRSKLMTPVHSKSVILFDPLQVSLED
eukprot:1137764-Pelagomonas_calceolata.AAC.4